MDKLTPSEEEIHHDIDDMSMNITPPNSPRTLYELRYVGDIKSPHLATRRAKRALNLAKLTIKKQRRQILTLQQTTTRMRNCLKIMKDLIGHLKKKYFISDDTVNRLMTQLLDPILQRKKAGKKVFTRIKSICTYIKLLFFEKFALTNTYERNLVIFYSNRLVFGNGMQC